MYCSSVVFSVVVIAVSYLSGLWWWSVLRAQRRGAHDGEVGEQVAVGEHQQLTGLAVCVARVGAQCIESRW